MKKFAAMLAAGASILTASAAMAAPLVDPTVALSSTQVSKPTALTLSHTTVTDVPANNFILRFQLPSDFTSQRSTDQFDCTGITLSINGKPQVAGAFDPCGVQTAGWVYVRTPALAPAGSNVVVTLDDTFFETPATPGVKTFVLFHTADGSGAPIDEATPLPAVTISAPVSVPTMSEWAMIILAVALAGGSALYLQRRRTFA